ncbi:hypothetical protein SH1V18_38160 [Vallitalea longa]|jgi:hypothetical protein|uniref:Uncharacterized protein n=1 Tax=Vallitalea longa TaxID=2936439 RepID=A0A9W6DFK8_9FIRM|nr:hypothetical protein [Vallitalea longa]GKX31336.1 hypothetical protein SH1V18_38160 [Vallitalea longa]
MRKTIISVMLSIILICSYTVININAKDYNNDDKLLIERANSILDELGTEGEDYLLQESSMDISVPKINMEAYIRSKQEEINTKGNIKNNQLLRKDTISEILKLYPELDVCDLDNWTYGKYYEYDTEQSMKKYLPTDKEIIELSQKGLKVDDAQRLKSTYGSYKAILDRSNDEIKDALEQIYLSDLESAKNLVVQEPLIISKFNSRGPINDPPDNSTTYTMKVGGDGVTYLKYYWCNVSGYKCDWFLEDTNTHRGDNNITYGARANVLFQKLYNTTESYSSESMWGSYSNSRKWPHEAIDFDYGRGSTVYATFSDDPSISGDATLKISKAYYGRIVYVCGTGSYKYTVSLQHVGDRITSGPISYDDPIGSESGYGANSDPYDFASHTHISIRKGDDTTWDVYDKTLDSDNIYSFVYYHLY